MSTFEDKQYRWRETYFVLFDAKKRPKMNKLTKALLALNKRFQLSNLSSDPQGYVDSLTLISPDDYAALDICYTGGEEVLEQSAILIEDFRKLGGEENPPVPWSQIKSYDGRFDVLHFERIGEQGEEEEDDELLDPGTLLSVLKELARLTHGVAVDPQSGTFITDL